MNLENLEAARIKLGLSRRQICKLLKVDPSAWTRWMKSPKGAPPHVHQSIEWYMKLVEQNPAENAPFALSQQIEDSNKQSKIQITRMKRELEHLRREHVEKKEVFEQLGSKIQNSFENILLKFRDQMIPLKMAEVDTLKYENNKLLSTVQDLEVRLNKITEKLNKVSDKKAKSPIKKTKKKISKKKAKKTTKKKAKANIKKVSPRSTALKKKAKKNLKANRTKRKAQKKR